MQALKNKLFLDTEIICRTPGLALDDQLESKFEDLKSMIMESSPDFYQVIKGIKKEDLTQQSDKILYTLWKYFNRAKYRATPFGKFSSISVVPLMDTHNIILADILKSKHLTDWQNLEISNLDAAAAFNTSKQFIANTSLYKVGNEYRYVFLEAGQFAISNVPSFPELDFLIDLCTQKQSKNNIYNRLSEGLDLSNPSIKRLMIQLISVQIIIPDCTPNITGEDYFTRYPVQHKDPKRILYTITERALVHGGYSHKTLKQVPELIDFLNTHIPQYKNPNLQAFLTAFKRKFELRFVPLSSAIDPELGIGYAHLGGTQFNKITDLADNFNKRSKDQTKQIEYNSLLVFLLNKSKQGNIIQLEEYEGEAFATQSVLPNTFSVILHHWNSFGVIEHIGGATANSLIGRFSMGIPAVENMGRRLAAIEQAANPDVLFFDVAYHSEGHIDNVNRRKAFYEHELPILTWSCFDEPLRLEDILVGVQDNEIILFSKKYQKRLVPRIPSAYNYNRSDLPVFRFLCDLQHQKIVTKLNFKLSELLPGLDHYSRVAYKDLIISPETWLLPDGAVNDLIANKQDSKLLLSQWLKQINLNVPFTVGGGDQTLIIKPTVDDDLLKFAIYCRKNANQPIYLSEACISNDNVVVNQSGKSLAAQIILNYYHHEMVYRPVDYSLRGIQWGSKPCVISPGDGWLYFAIYSHPSRFDQLLKSRIADYLNIYKKHIASWFFIRFDDNGPHLRLRLRVKHKDHSFILIEALNKVLKNEVQTGIVTDIQIKSYHPEISRYGKDRINHVEDLFHQDSSLILDLLKRNYASETIYGIALTTMHKLIGIAFPSYEQQIDFVNFMAKSYSHEFAMSHEDYKLINMNAKTYLFVTQKIQLNRISNRIRKLESQFAKLLMLSSQGNDRYALTADIIHMHINRLLPFDQRAHEAILYQYLTKLVKTRAFLAKQAPIEASL